MKILSKLPHPGIARPIHPRLYTSTVSANQCPGPKFTCTAEEYENAKPFKDIPGPSLFKFISDMAFPWSPYFRKDNLDMFKGLQKEYGNLVKMPTLMGKRSIYILFDAKEVEVIFRNEGPTPFRMTLEITDRFKKQRPDLFGEISGLIQE